jgi:hypothetical protein
MATDSSLVKRIEGFRADFFAPLRHAAQRVGASPRLNQVGGAWSPVIPQPPEPPPAWMPPTRWPMPQPAHICVICRAAVRGSFGSTSVTCMRRSRTETYVPSDQESAEYNKLGSHARLAVGFPAGASPAFLDHLAGCQMISSGYLQPCFAGINWNLELDLAPACRHISQAHF